MGRGYNKNSNKFSLGFTLVELLVVIGTLSILIAIIIATINPFAQFAKANDAKRKADLSQIQKAVEVYYQDKGIYPPSSTVSPMYRLENLLNNNLPSDWGTAWMSAYMSILPKDPVSGTRRYVYYSTGQSYWLYASLERPNDPQLCHNDGSACDSMSPAKNNIASNACGTTCNYGVSSSNVSP